MKITCKNKCGREFWVRLKSTADYIYNTDLGIMDQGHESVVRIEEPTADHTYTCVDCGEVETPRRFDISGGIGPV